MLTTVLLFLLYLAQGQEYIYFLKDKPTTLVCLTNDSVTVFQDSQVKQLYVSVSGLDHEPRLIGQAVKSFFTRQMLLVHQLLTFSRCTLSVVCLKTLLYIV